MKRKCSGGNCPYDFNIQIGSPPTCADSYLTRLKPGQQPGQPTPSHLLPPQFRQWQTRHRSTSESDESSGVDSGGSGGRGSWPTTPSSPEVAVDVAGGYPWFGGVGPPHGSSEDDEGLGEYDGFGRLRSSTIAPSTEINKKKLPTVFKWEGGGKTVCISGSFDQWKTKIPMVKSHGDFYTIIDLPEGTHEYKFQVDGQWVCDSSEEKKPNDVGSENNVVSVKSSDFEVFEALDMDSVSTGHHEGMSGSPPGEYTQEVPPRVSGHGWHHSGPPILPPHLLQVILNKETPLHCEPTLLPEPNHVMLNHLYALSIKDGVMVLSATHRYRKKYVTTLLYKPI